MIFSSLSFGVWILPYTLLNNGIIASFVWTLQSAERWKDVGIDSALYNFEQHALRAGFQLVRNFFDLLHEIYFQVRMEIYEVQDVKALSNY